MMLFCRLVASMFCFFFYTGVLIMCLVALGIFSLKEYMGFVNLVIFLSVAIYSFLHLISVSCVSSMCAELVLSKSGINS